MNEYTSLQQLFPDVGEELENRHSSHFGDLKRRFGKTYAGNWVLTPDYEPQWFVSAKSILRVAEVFGAGLALSMASENGTVLAAAATHLQEHIYINTEEQHAEIVLNCKGELLEGHSELAELVSEAYQKGVENAVISKLSGAIIYFDVTVEQRSRGYRESIAMAMARAAIAINGLAEEQTLEDLEERLLVAPLQRIGYGLYDNLTMVLSRTNDLCEVLPLVPGGYTFLCCAIDDSAVESASLKTNSERMQLEVEALEVISSMLMGSYSEHQHRQSGCTSLTALFNMGQLDKLQAAMKPGVCPLEEYEQMLGVELPTSKFSNKSIAVDLHQYGHILFRRLTTFIEQYRTLKRLSREPPTKQSFKTAFAESLKSLQTHNLITTRGKKLLEICEQSGAFASTISENYVIALYEKNQMLHAFELLRNCLYEFTSGDEEQQTTPHRIKKMLFSSLPSRGCGTLDPSQQIWFM